MSFDVFLQAFKGGDAADGDGDAVLDVLAPWIVEHGDGWVRIATSDGGADVYGIDTPASGVMCRRIEGRAAWDVVLDVARAAGFVVMPVGCGTVVTDDAQRAELPDDLPEPVVTATSGLDLLTLIEWRS